ncbi:MAG: GntR family transcriptional regulator [Clostridiales bacterium]|jgi:GntR family transcriptional repressor for pyruvate dehydrogenase complex|nr:GntR family transcriptional regulator [Clostridiales bacterium]
MFIPIKNTKVYEQVIEQIKRMIMDGTLKKGDKLPTERDLAEQLQVSRASVREALTALDVIGLVESRHGAGNYIRENFENSLFEPMSMMFLLEKGTPLEILELRQVLEVEAAVLAAARINDDEVQTLGEVVHEMKTCTDEDRSVVLDKEFHFSIAKASKNLLIINILQVISQLIDEFIKDSRKKILMVKDNRVKLTKQHERLYNALKNRDRDEARKAMAAHFKLVEEYINE